MRYLNMWFRENLGLKIIAVAIALFLWAHVMVGENRAGEIDARIVTRNMPEGLTKLSQSPGWATVSVSGLRRQIQALSPAQVVLVADLTGLAAGEHTVALRSPDLPRGLKLEAVSPATVVVVLDKVVDKTYPLSVSLRGEPAPGYALGTPQPSRREVKVSGAAGLIAKVSRVVAEVDASGISGATELSATVKVLDDRGEPLEGLRVSPAEVEVVVPVTRGSESRKTVPVRPELGEPATGYQVTSVVAKPAEIALIGSPEALGALDAVSTELIPLVGLTNTGTYTSKVVLPAGVKREGEGQIEVTVTVGPAAAEGTPQPKPPPPVEGGPGLSPGATPQPGAETSPAPSAAPAGKSDSHGLARPGPNKR